jgi:hypothetical protein
MKLKNMSRSRKKTSITGITFSPSEKQDKRLYNRRYRRVCKQNLESNIETELLPHLRDYSNPWSMNKDGKKWFDAKKYPKNMRK